MTSALQLGALLLLLLGSGLIGWHYWRTDRPDDLGRLSRKWLRQQRRQDLRLDRF